FHEYFVRQTKDYFYRLLKPLADLASLTPEEFVDWGHNQAYQPAIGVGECAGVIIDLVSTLLFEAEEKLEWARESYAAGAWSDAIFHSYSVFISGAKALLLDKGINNSSTQMAIINAFEEQFVASGELALNDTFTNITLKIKSNEPTESFATSYLQEAEEFYQLVSKVRELANT